MQMKKRVMVIEDDLVVARSTTRILEKEYDVEVFKNAEEAYAALLNKPYDAIVSDVNLPKMSGPEFLVRVKRARPEMLTRFVFHTASLEPSNLRIFPVPVLMKPSPAVDLLRMVRSLVKCETTSG